MKRKNTAYASVGTLVGLIVGLISYNLFVSKPAGENAIVDSIVSRSSATSNDKGRADTAIRTTSASASGTLVLSGVRGVADSAMVKVAFRHPELKLTPEVAGDLQEVFSRHYRVFAEYQARIARATPMADGSTEIRIPAFPIQANELMENMLADVSGYYKGAAPQGVIEAMEEIYSDYTNAVGRNSVTLQVRTSSDPMSQYSYSKTTVIMDLDSGKVQGIGTSNGVLLKEDMQLSPYIELKKFFPEPRGRG